MLSHEGSSSDQLEVVFFFFQPERLALGSLLSSWFPFTKGSCPSRVRGVLRACDPCHERVTALARSLEEHQLTRDCSVRR